MKHSAFDLNQIGFLSDIDREFGRFCSKRAVSKAAGTLGLLAALVSHARSRGDSCLLLENWAGKVVEDEFTLTSGKESSPHLPDLDACLDLLRSQPLVGDGSRPTPLVLEGKKLYLYRYWRAECDLAAFLRTQRISDKSKSDTPIPKDFFGELFHPMEGEIDWQAVGAFAALKHPFTLITGGPGTGKTTTVVRMLAILLKNQPHLRIALTAPTGKAVARLAESITHQIGRIPHGASLSIPTEVQTLHRLLGYQPFKDRFRFNRQLPLPFDLVMVDEASMVDVLMMANLVRAMPSHSRLVLLGDHQQLASVDAGSILADISQAARIEQPHSAAFCSEFADLTGQILPAPPPHPQPWRDHVVHLQKSRRFSEDTGLGAFSKAVQRGDINAAMDILQNPKLRDLQCQDLPASDEALLQLLEPFLQPVLKAKSLEDAFAAFQSWQLLTGLREGKLGVTGLNTLIEQYLRRKGLRFTGAFYPKRPILITHNDYTNQLFNGDLGLCWLDSNQQLKAYFPVDSGGFKAIPLMKLSAVESAWALTVHKSQGSEFDEILFVLPPVDHLLATRELVYTGITRAKSKATLLATPTQVSHALERVTQRASGLSQRLQVTSG